MKETPGAFFSFSPGSGIDAGLKYGVEEQEGSTILSQQSRSSSAFRTKMGYISFNAAELKAGANIRLCHQPTSIKQGADQHGHGKFRTCHLCSWPSFANTPSPINFDKNLCVCHGFSKSGEFKMWTTARKSNVISLRSNSFCSDYQPCYCGRPPEEPTAPRPWNRQV